jgi:hypothetical protein
VKFTTKVDDKHIKEILQNLNPASLKNDFKNISKEITTGKECELTGFMRGSESKLGRSNVIDLNKPNGVNYR